MEKQSIIKYVLVALVLLVSITLSLNVFAAKLKSNDIAVGTGEVAMRHSKVSVLYTGWLKNGKEFDSNQNKNRPFVFTLGTGQVIPGWDMGVEGMKVGGKRSLIIPPELAYGKRGTGPIPANATLRFEVELLAVNPPKYNNIDNATLKSMLSRGVKIVDLRRLDEWNATGVVKGSELITAFDNKGKFIRSFPKKFQDYVNPDEEIILICRTGNRSSMIANMLVEQAGFTKVYNVVDGIVKWTKEGNEVVKY